MTAIAADPGARYPAFSGDLRDRLSPAGFGIALSDDPFEPKSLQETPRAYRVAGDSFARSAREQQYGRLRLQLVRLHQAPPVPDDGFPPLLPVALGLAGRTLQRCRQSGMMLPVYLADGENRGVLLVWELLGGRFEMDIDDQGAMVEYAMPGRVLYEREVPLADFDRFVEGLAPLMLRLATSVRASTG